MNQPCLAGAAKGWSIMNSPSPQTDWSSIPDEILTSIAGKIVSVDDYVSFSAVCRSWYSLAADFHNNHKPQFQPLFMPGVNPGSRKIKFRNPASGKTLTVDLPPETAGATRLWGTPFGWLIVCDRPFEDQSRVRFSLFNPFTGATIPLPNYPRCFPEDRFFDKLQAILTANPDSDPDDCFAVLYNAPWFVITARVATDERWCVTQLCAQDDITYFNGILYGLELYSGRLRLDRLDPRLSPPLISSEEQSLNIEPFHEALGPHLVTQKHVFVLNGELCLCLRYYYSGRSKTNDFKIFRIDPSSGDLAPVMSLGDHCLFLGSNYSFACKASYPRAWIFERAGDGDGGFVSDLVFFSYRRGWPISTYYNRPFDVEVWDFLHSRRVCRKRDAKVTLCEGLWIVPSLTMFRKLEDVSTSRTLE